MFAAAQSSTPGRRFGASTWISLVLLLVTVVAMVSIGKITPLTQAVVFGVAATGAAGTLLVAWLMSGNPTYPRWVWLATGGIMALALLVSVPLVNDPVLWNEEVKLSAWMIPWFMLVLGRPRSRRGSAARVKPAWIIIATGAVLSAILLGLPSLVQMFENGGPVR